MARAHVRLSLAREPASTELGSGDRDACPPIRVCLCLVGLLRCGIARCPYIPLCFLSSAVTRRQWLRCVLSLPSLACRPSRDLLFVARPATGQTARTAPILGILEIVGRKTFARAWSSPFYNAQGIGTRHRYPCTCTTTSILLSARQLHSDNPYPYSEPTIRKVILYCLAHHYMYGVV
jgi:hypothetical protein